MLFKSPGKRGTKDPDFSLNRKEKEELLKIAQRSVETAVKEGMLFECVAAEPDALQQQRGAFVTLRKKGQLRGCIGRTAPEKPLYLTVRDVAALAALKDPRFSPLTPAELNDLQYEVSVLSSFRHVLEVKEIQVGHHGLLVKRGAHEGLLLPQVATEQGWDRKTFLDSACLKAGLPRRAWRGSDTDIFIFSALIFGEQKAPEGVTPEGPAFPTPTDPPKRPGPD